MNPHDSEVTAAIATIDAEVALAHTKEVSADWRIVREVLVRAIKLRREKLCITKN